MEHEVDVMPTEDRPRDPADLARQYRGVRRIVRQHPQWSAALGPWIARAQAELVAVGYLDGDAYPTPRRPMGPAERRARLLEQLAALRSIDQAAGVATAAAPIAPGPDIHQADAGELAPAPSAVEAGPRRCPGRLPVRRAKQAT
jgi:hypothetical protein